MGVNATDRHVAKARSEVCYATDRHSRGTAAGKIARRAYHKAVRRAAAAEIEEALYAAS